MFSLLMCFIVIIHSEAKFQQSGHQEIRFRLQDVYKSEFEVEKDNPLDIVLVNFYAKYAWCLNFYYTTPNDKFIPDIALNGSTESVITVPKVTDAMITKWWCVVLQEYHDGKYYEYGDHKYTAHDIVFNLHVKRPSHQEICFRLQDVYKSEFEVEKDNPLDIVLVNFYAKYAWCLNFYYTTPNDKFIADIALNGSTESVITVPKVTDAMITKWWCVVLQEYHDGKYYEYGDHKYTAHDIVFNLHVKRPNYNIIYIISAVVLCASVLLVIIIILSKRFYCQKSKPPLQPKVNSNVDSVFYLNLEIFRRQYERELQAQEPEYEEIE